MRIGIVGGGPAGLYFALLMKRRNPSHEIRVVEQNPAGATYGWGIVFSDRALAFLESYDPESYAEIEKALEKWDDQAIVHRGQKVRIDGFGFSGIARIELLRILQDHCRRRGVEIEFERRLTDLTSLADRDLIVGADGAHSVVRETCAANFQPTVELLSNKYVWYGTSKLFDTLTLTFRENWDGAFVAHHYRYGATASTFLVECDAATWGNAGFESMSQDESRAYCEEVFRDDLDGEPLLMNRSSWTSFRAITNRRWSHGNVVLIGDALRTVHFSIGSGTRMALEDAIHLYDAFEANEDIRASLCAFESARRPSAERFLGIAAQSSRWYERFREKLHLEPLPFAYDYVMRSGMVSHDELRKRSPRFVAACDAFSACYGQRFS